MTSDNADPQNDAPPADPVDSPAGSPKAPAQEIVPEKVTELAHDSEAQRGDCPPEEIEKLRPICSLADQNYSQVLGLIKEIKSAENVLQRFHARDADVSPQDVEEAKKRFDQAKQSYIQLGNQINDGIKQVFAVAKTYPDDFLVQHLYKVYLAKLLASLETRYPIQPFVEAIATEGFEFEREANTPADEETQRGETPEKVAKARLEETLKHVTMLSVRYQKRQLANRMRQGEEKSKIIERLMEFKRLDPVDINTFIWLANLKAGDLKKEKDQNKRLTMRNEVLEYCQNAFSGIDEYLNLQNIENLNERDKIRSEYIKTITSIRRPLMDGGA